MASNWAVSGAGSAIKFSFVSSVPSAGKIRKTAISLGDFAKINSEPHIKFILVLLDVRRHTLLLQH